MVVGTAGHVDHGKTCLIKALTGVDTDRLKEEKKRGITIELGFAKMQNDRGLNIGVIDVPGHEKFIKNMLAGVGGIDMVLLVVAADEGIMPQTVEHFEILKMLHVKNGIVAITKTDIVDEEWLEIVRDDINEMVSGTFLEHAPVVEVSAHTGHNIPELKELICGIAGKTEARRLQRSLLRVPVDRVFTIDGFGTVVTGTLIEGTVAVGDEVTVYPAGKPAKVRHLQVHGETVDKAFAGQRTALNLTGIKKEELQRGDVLAIKGALKPTMILDVRIDMFKDSPRMLVSGSRLHLYCGSAEVLCKVVLLDAEQLESGQSGYAQLRLEEEVALRKDDRFILRFYSPLASIGGGVVLNSNPARRRRYQEETLQSFSVKEAGESEEVLEQVLLEESKKMLSMEEAGRLAGLASEEAEAIFASLAQKGRIARLTGGIAVHTDYLNYVKEKASALMELFHSENPFRPGMPKEEFRKRLAGKLFLNSRLVEALIDRMIGDETIADNGNLISLPGFAVTYTPETLELKQKIEESYRARGFEAPETDECINFLTDCERPAAAELIDALRREGRLEKLAHNCFIHSDCLADAVGLLEERMAQNGEITLSEYRDMLGTSRKYAVRILEYLDQQKVTRLVGDVRVLV